MQQVWILLFAENALLLAQEQNDGSFVGGGHGSLFFLGLSFCSAIAALSKALIP